MVESRKFPGLRATGRREFLRALLACPGLLAPLRGMQSALLAKSWPAGLALEETVPAKVWHERVTANSDFFIRNHFRTPQISSDGWSLAVSGFVGQPRKWSYSDLLLMNSVRHSFTMECAGNISGGAGVGNAVWSGVQLAQLLNQAGVKSNATTVIFHGADAGDGEEAPANTHFARAIPLAKAMEPSTLLAYEMNGSPLPADHGFPLRVLVPGWYGMDSVKWLTHIEITDQPFDGYFQQKYYVALGASGTRRSITRMLVNSKFLRPSEGEEIHTRPYRIEGFAWAGERKIVKVELRMGQSDAWRPATVADSSQPLTWVLWRYEWHAPGSGQYTLDVRATDDEGNTQPDVRDPDRRDAYELNSPHRITVVVRL